MNEPQAARPTQHVSEKALEDLDHNAIEPPPVSRHDIPEGCLLYTSPSPRDRQKSRMPSSA